MAANTPTTGVGTWSLISGSGTITNSLSPTTAITALGLGDNVFEWTITSGTCTSVSDVTVTVDANPTIADAGLGQVICISSATTVLNGNNPAIGTGTWSVLSGTITITNPNLNNTTVTGLTVGTSILQWEIGNGSCASSTSTMSIQVDDIPTTADASINQTVCISSPSATLNGNTPSVGTGTWSVLSGTATITSPNTPGSTVTGLAIGTTILQWEIANGSCASSTSTMSIQVDPAPTIASAGSNQTVCISSPTATLNGNAPSIGTGTWSVLSGTATITNPNLNNTTVTGLALGTIILQWTIGNGVCANTTSTMSIQVDPAPTIASAGSNQTVCISSPTATLNGNTPAIGTGTWSLISGTATITSPNTASSTVTGLALGINILQWEIGNASCASTTSTMSIQVDPAPSLASAGSNQTVCISSSATLNGNAPSVGTGTWSILSGTATITNPNLNNTTVTGLSLGTTILQWTIGNGVCVNTSATVSIQVDPGPTIASAGSNQTVCISSPTATLNGNTPAIGTGTWSVLSGTATITSPNTPGSTVTGLALGINILQWTIGNGVCANSTSTVSIQVDPAPTVASAGSNQTVCISSPTATLNGNTPTVGTGTWSVISGTATITSPNTPGSTVTGLALGINILQWTIGNGVCANTSATVSIQVDPGPTIASAGSNQTVCISSPTTTLNGNAPSVGTGTWSVLSGTATITNPNLNNTTVTGLSIGTNILQWTIGNGVCANTTSTMSIQVDPAPTVASAGSNQTVCISSPTATLNGNTPTVGTGTWSVLSGTATITSPNTPGSTVTGLALGINILQWTIGNGVCANTNATVSIQVDPGPTIASAGSNQTVCISSPTATLNGNAPSIGTGTWSVLSGTATITNPNLNNTTVTGLALGTNILQWSIGNGVCANTTSTMSVQVDPAPTIASAGSNQTVCISSPTATLNGNAPSVGTGTWSVLSGTATITNPSLNNTTVTGLALGTNILQWTIGNGVCANTSSTMSIQVDPAPTIASAGSNQTVCISSPTATLNGNTPAIGTGTWSVPSGTATITSPNTPGSTVTGLALGTTILQWTIGNGVCANTTSTISIQVDPAPTVASAGSNQTVCVSSTATLNGNAPSVGTGTWSVLSGTATITNPNLNNTTVTGLSLGAIVLQWTIGNGVCANTTSTMSIQVDPAPTIASAGSNQTICISSPTTTLNGNAPSVGTGTWSVISGTATITNPNLNNTAVTGLALGTNILQWAIGNGVCANTTSTMSIQVDPAPTIANAGSNQTVCISSPTATLNGNTPAIGTGTWSVLSGTATITSPNAPGSTVTGLALGINILQWSIGNGVCANTTSTMSIQVDPAATIANAGSNQTVCISSPTATLNGNTPAIGTGTWSLISGTATITSPNTPGSTVTGLALGTTILQWTIGNGVCANTSATVSIQVDPGPTIASAGSNQTVCISSPTATLNGNAPSVGTGTWSVLSGTATITSPNTPGSTATGLALGTTILQWTIGNGVCASTSSTMSIQVDPAPTIASAGSNQTVCISSPSAALNGNTPSIGTGTWSVVSGTATITSPNTPGSTVTGLALGINILQWTIGNGVCANTSSTMSIQVDPAPTIASAGSNQTICISSPTTTLNGNAPSVGTGTWSVISGTATITNPNLNNTAVTGLTLGTNILQWTIGNGVCANSTSTVSIQVDPAPTVASAGSNQTVCISSPTATLNGNTPAIGTGTWSVISGTATITSPNTPGSTVTGLALGINILQWTIGNGVCANTTSTMSIQVDPAPTIASAGSNQTVCISSPTVTLNGNAPSIGTGTWSVLSGTATITNPNLNNTTVTGLALGINILQWTIGNGVCANSTSTVSIQVDPAPTIASAGSNQTVCISSPTATLNGNVPSIGTGTWSVLSGTATITSPNTASSTVTGLALGINILQWTIGNGVCANTTSTMSIQVDPAPTVASAGSNQTVCISSPTATLNGNTPAIGTGTWSVLSGTATITSPNTPGSSVTGLALGTNILQWTIGNGVCANSTSTVSIQVDPAPTIASAGSNQTVCISSPTATLNGNAPSVGTGTWSVLSGTATITNPNLNNTAVTGLALGTNILQWTIGNGVCANTTSTMSIQVDPAPTVASAGSNQTVCISSPTATLNGNSPSVGTGTWSVVSGTGTITSPNTPSSTVTGLALGTTILQWSIGNGVCANSTSTMSIQVDPAPTVASAGSNQTVCISSPTATLNGNTPAIGTGTWSVLSGTATITSPNTPGSTVTGLALGTNILQWTIGNGVCANTSSTMSIQVDPAPTIASAGSNQTVCISSPTATLNGNAPSVGTGTWSVVSGTGTITSPNTPSSTVTGLALGTTILQWSIGNGVCANSTSTMSIQVDPAPTVASAGSNQTVCISSPTATLNGNTPAIGTGTWSVLSGTATITSPNTPGSTVTGLALGTNILQWTIGNGVCANTTSTMSIQVDPAPTIASAGSNQTVCISSPSATLNGNIPSIGTGTWSVLSGTATITSPNAPGSTVTGLALGINILQWSIGNGVCANTTSTMSIQVDPAPTIASAGSNQTVCISSPTATLNGNAPSVGTGTWSVLSGTATITNPNLNNTTVTGLALGTNILQWTIGNGVCANTTSTMSIQVDPAPTIASAGSNQTICISSPTATLNGNAPSIGTGTWSVLSGTATITNPNLNNTTVMGLALGINILQWTIGNGVCANTTSTVSIQVDPGPTIASAGSNQTVCISSPTTTLNGNTPAIGTGTWSVISGTATITSPNTPGSTVTGLALGINILQWTIGNGVCANTTSTMSIQVDPAPTVASAGSNQTVCISSPTATLNGNTPATGTGTWSVISGTATITSPNTPGSTVTGLALGINILQWTIGNGVCANTTSTMSIQVDPAPTVASAGSNQTVCISSPTTTLNGNAPSVGTGTWSVLSGTATITNPNLNNTTVTGLSLGTNVLQWSIGNGVCASTTSTMSIQVDPAPTIASAGSNQTVCISSPTATLNGNTPAIGTGTWSVISGTATITSPNTPGSTVTGLALGINILQWTIGNGVCANTSATVSIQVDPGPTIASAGSNQTLCILSPTTTLNGNVPSIGTGTWSVLSGTATITSPNTASSTVTGLALGINILQWSIGNGVCANTTSTMSIQVDQAPTIANAGSSQTLCILNPTTTLAGNTPTFGVGTWSFVAGGGTITSPNNPSTTVTGLSLGTNVLQWTITNNGACPQTISTKTIQVDQAPTIAVAGSNQTLCILNPTTTLAGNTPTFGVGTWSFVTGGGTITSPNNPSTTVTGLSLGTNVLQWTITNNGVCPQTISTMTIQVDQAPTIAFAGSNQVLCILNPTTTLAGNTPVFGIGTWSVISGGGTITSPNNPTTTVTGLALGTNVLQWSITTNGACPQTISTMTITVNPAPSIALAGPNQTLCILNPTTTLAGNTPTSGIGTWAVILGSATITSPNSPTTSVTNVGLGTNILQWTITNGGACPQTVSTMVIQVDPAPSIALAGPNQTLCILNPTTTLAGNTPTSGVGTWSVISGSGTITSVNNPSTTVTNIGLGINVLQWSITNNGACPQTISTMTIQVDQAPTIAVAGSNQTLCILNPTTTLAGNTPTFGVGTWSFVTGGGTITSPNNPSTTVTGLSLGTNVLQWTITNNGACPQTISTKTIQVDQAPTIAVAGSNQTLCILNPTTTLAGNTPTFGVGTWSFVTGGGTITSPNNPSTTVTGLALGNNVLQWSITNNGACPQTISNMTIQVDQAPTIAVAGSNQTLCILNPTTTLAGNTPTFGVGTWSFVTGGGTITSPNNPSTTVTGLSLGTNVLQWTITNNGACPQTTSTKTIQVDQAPTIAFAGPSQTICILNPTTTLAGNTPTFGVGTWSVISGSGTITSVNNPSTTVTNLGLGINVLQWSITNNGACPQTISTMTIQVDQAPTIAAAGSNQTLCILNPTTTLAGNTPTFGVGTWSIISGGGTITSPNNPSTTVTGLALGTNILQWTIATAGVCGLTTSTMSIQVDQAPTIAAAGPSQTLCILNPTTTLAGNTPTFGVGTWSIVTGGGTITSPNNPSTTVTGLSLGTNVLQWTITNNGACPQTISTMTIQVDQAPTIAAAGSNQTLCILNPTTTLTGNTPVFGIGTWSVVTGSATFNNANNPTTTAAGFNLGTNVLQWTITNNGTCPQTISTVTIIVNPAPSIASAGSSQTLCILNPTTTLAANTPTSGVGTWSVILGSATITSPNNPSTTVTGIGLGNNVLQWSITNNGACPQTVSTMTIQVDQAPTIAVAGPNQTVCISSNSTTLSGNTPTVGIGTWSVLVGSGTITSPNNPSTTVTNLGLGINILQWSITNNGACPQTFASMAIQVDPAPSISNAGSNQTICISSPTTVMTANTPTTGVGTWSLISGGGTIVSPNSPTTTITGLPLGINIFKWSIANGVCPTTTSTMSIQVDNIPTIAAAGPNQTVCISSPTATLAGNNALVGIGTWSVISGSGTITSPNNPASTITGLGLGINIIKWSIANGVCATTTSTMSIQVDNVPTTAAAGASQTLCISNPSLTMAGNVPTVGTGLWTQTFGTGTITTPTLATTTVTNLGLGQNIFLWTISNGVCAQSVSSIIITIDPLPSASFAGSNQTVCISSPTAAMNGNNPAVGTGTWSVVSGSGTFPSPNSNTSTVVGLALGTNILQWSIGTVGCAPNNSTLSVKVDQVPTLANAGPNQTLCINNPTTTLNANTPIVGSATWSIIAGGGVLTASTSPNSAVTGLPTGTNVLQWTITNGVCAPSISTMSIQVDNNTIFASAGPNQTLCAASPTAVMAGNTPTVGVGTWAILVGSGSIATPSLANTTVSNLGVGTNILQWTIVNGVCSFNSSVVYIYVVPSPGVPNAGPSQTLCISSPTTMISANSPSLGTASWSVVSGSANIVTPTTPTSSVLSIGLGNNILAWTMTYSVCSLTSTLNLHVDNIPSIPVAGPNQTICVSSPTTVMAANTPTSGAGTWSLVSGTGVITTPTLATTSITGLGLGVNVFKWTINGGGCGTNSSTMSIQVDNLPTTANAGGNQTICISNPTATLTGNTPVTGIGTWSVISGGGAVTTPTLATSTITGLSLGVNILQWTIANGVCLSSSTMSIQVDDAPTISAAGASQSICASSPTTALTGNTALIGTGTWSVIGGSGIVTTPTLSTSNVTALGLGLNILQWTIANGVCASSTSTTSIQVDPAPTIANAGSNQILCISSASATLAGNSTTVGIGTWSFISGSGTFTNPNLNNTTVTGLALGLNILQWSITSGACGTTTSTMSIQVDDVPTISAAGPNQTLCITSPTTVLNGNTPTVGSGLWSVIVGSGTITTPTLATGNVTGLGLGVNTLQWTISNGSCGSSTSTTSIQIDQVPTAAVASSNQTVCITSPTVTLTGNMPTVGTGTWILTSGSGTITSPSSAVTTATNLALGINIFEWDISNGSCATSTSSISVLVDPAPTIAAAGPNQTLCITSPVATMAANNAAIGTGSWSVVSGSGTITSVNLETTTITNIGLGNNVFAWTIFGNCGSSTSNVTITVDQLPTTAVASSNQTICITSPTATITGNVPTVGTGIWILTSGSGTITSPASAVTTVTNLALGLNVFEWDISNASCATSTSSLSILVDPIPTIAAAGPNQTICVSSPVATMGANNAAIGTGSWSVVSGSGTITSVNLETTTITNIGLGNNVFAWTIYGNCGSSTSNVTITVDQLPTTAVVSSNQTVCINSASATISGNVATVGTGVWNLTSGSGTITSPASAVTTVTNLAAGDNVFEWTISNASCPSSVADVTITVDPAPTTAAAGSNQTICISSPVASMNANTAAVGTGSWSIVSGSGTITSINLETTTITNIGLGNNVFAWTIYSGCGSSTSNVTITVDQVPTTAVAVADQTLCISTPSASISGNVPTVGTGAWTLVSGIGTITSPTNPTTTVTGLAAGINVFEWAITNGVCAPSTANVQITIDPMPTTAAAGPNQTVCISAGATMAANTAAVGTGSWSVVSGSGTITSVNLETTTITNLGSGNNVFAWTIYSGCGSSTSNVTITVNQVPTTALASPNQTVCFTVPTSTIGGNVPTVGTGTWTLVSGAGAITTPASATTNVTGLGIGINVFEWSVTNGVCPASTASVQITVDPAPTIASAGSNQTICISSPLTMNANIAAIGTGSWTVVSGSGIFTTPTSANTAVSGLSAGVNVFAWTITNNCSSSTSTVAVQADQLSSTALAGPDQNFCSVTTGNLNAVNPAFGSGTWSVIAGGASVTSPNLNTSPITGLSTGTTILVWSVTNGLCPATTDTVQIVIDAMPTTANAGPDQSSCLNAATLSGNIPSVGTGAWSVIGGGSSVTIPTLNNSGVTSLSTSTNILVWTVSNGICPVSTDTVVITVLPATVPAFAGNDTTIYDNQANLNGNNPTSGTGVWTIGSGSGNITNTTSYNTTVNSLMPGLNTFVWTITDACGTTRDEVNITLIDISLPNAISPNGDGKNDNFEIPFINSYSKVQLQILNRWGNIEFEDSSYNNGWFGLNQSGNPLAEDTYFYILKLDNFTRTGYITLKR